MLKDFFDKGKCALGFHTGDWAFTAQDQCLQKRLCPRCQNTSTQIVHSWLEWAPLTPGSCQLARSCSRCNLPEKKVEHRYGEATYKADGACDLVQPCQGCGELKPAGTAHLLDSWGYDSADLCNQTVSCSRCGRPGTSTRVAHDWGQLQTSEFYGASVKVCGRCADMVFSLAGAGGKISMQSVDLAVRDAMEASDTATLRDRVIKHKDVLLSPVTEKYFAFAIDQRADSDSARKTFKDFATVLDKCRAEGIDSVFRPAPAPVSTPSPGPSSGPRPAGAKGFDSRLFGHWRHNEPVSNFPSDTHCVYDNTGRFKWWSKSVSPFGVRESPPEFGSWNVSDQLLHLVFDDGTVMDLDYILNSEGMVWRNHGRYKFWSRIN